MRNDWKKFFGIGLLSLSLLLPQSAFGGYIRPNHFMDKSGSERKAEIKKFQAQHNLNVTGTLNDNTKALLHDPDYIVYDLVERAPSSGYWITINKSRRILTLYKGKQSVGKYPVTLGKSSTPTPTIKTKVANKWVNPAWGGGADGKPTAANDPNNPLGERWIGLAYKGGGTYGIHGNIKPWQIGDYASNGCIRMFNYDVETYVFPLIKIGSPVWIGTDKELAKWGIRQILEKVEAPAKEPAEKPEKKPEPVEPKPYQDDREAVTVLDF